MGSLIGNISFYNVYLSKHLGLILDEQPNFNERLESKTNKCYKIIDFLKRLSIKLLRDVLLRIYKSFVGLM